MANFLNSAFESRAASLHDMLNDRDQAHTDSLDVYDRKGDLKVYYLVGGVGDVRLKAAQSVAEKCLLNVEVDRELVREPEFADWAREVAEMVRDHDAYGVPAD